MKSSMKTALIIEDNKDNMDLITYILNKNEYKTVQAKTGAEGIEMALREKPDFVILDIQLPDIDGYEVLKRIRSSEIDGGVPVIAMTAFAMKGDGEKLLMAGCNGYIEKPINPENVINQIKKILGEET